MAQTAAATVAATLNIREQSWVRSIWQGGNYALIDRETAPSVKEGVLRELGNLSPAAGGMSFQPKVKSQEFIQAMATGIGVAVAELMSQLDPVLQFKINAPTYRSVGLALYGGAPTAKTQAVVSADAQKLIDGSAGTPFVLNVWYMIGAQNLTKFIASKQVDTTFTDLVAGSDYLLDTELGAIKFLSGGTNALAGTEKISCLYQAAAITATPTIALASVPRYTYGGFYIYTVVPVNEERSIVEVYLSYIPRARIKPTGNFDIGSDKPAEITLDVYPLPSSEISGYPFGFALWQIGGTQRLTS